MTIDLPRALRLAAETGDVRFGVRQVHRAIRGRQAKLVILASNCPEASLGALGEVRVFRFPGTNVELGASCGVPFSVSALAILNPGDSNILSA